MRRTIISATVSIALSTTALAQTARPSGSAGACGTLYQQAASAASARIAADDKDIAPPQTVKSLTCLDNILKGVGLNVVVNLLDPTNLFNAIEGQLCNAVTNAWKKALGSAQCGITLSGFNLGAFNFGGSLGGGLLPQAELRRRRAAHGLHRHRRGRRQRQSLRQWLRACADRVRASQLDRPLVRNKSYEQDISSSFRDDGRRHRRHRLRRRPPQMRNWLSSTRRRSPFSRRCKSFRTKPIVS